MVFTGSTRRSAMQMYGHFISPADANDSSHSKDLSNEEGPFTHLCIYCNFPFILVLRFSNALALIGAITEGLMGPNWRQADPLVSGSGGLWKAEQS